MAIVKFQPSVLTALRGAKNRLDYLTQNDWLLIADKAEPIEFENGEKLFSEGNQTKAVYLLVKGTVGIQAHAETEIAQIGPGEICGEMGYLETANSSATAIANEEVETLAISWSALDDLFALYPHLASRFYRSVARPAYLEDFVGIIWPSNEISLLPHAVSANVLTK